MLMGDEDLMRMATPTGLRSLQMTAHRVTANGVDRLQKALPQLTVGCSYNGRLRKLELAKELPSYP
jgi:hypothetical protein